MKVRSDIAALIAGGHTDAHIAHRLGCHRMTVYRARQAMARKLVDPQQRLFAEELPTGRVRDYVRWRQPITPAQAAANRRALEEALRPPPTARVRDLTAYSDIHARRAERRTRRTAA
ncbi:helix-turn-helix domain-containing protein [Streptomyces natalensis]|uniref:helix-turn-helix domain-containing protein n=1 Tax=Streptomyces natalensis TaxID=68242 RepID=UPI0007C44B54|nr:helix-turn-helix domain-containing protein [Streptomyces natalensis]